MGIWSHSRPYDDAILLLAATALLRVIVLSDGRVRAIAITLFALAVLAFLTPIWVFYGSPAPTLTFAHSIQAILWTVVLIVMGWHATCRMRSADHETLLENSRAPVIEQRR